MNSGTTTIISTTVKTIVDPVSAWYVPYFPPQER
jgi:hypothetical protein